MCQPHATATSPPSPFLLCLSYFDDPERRACAGEPGVRSQPGEVSNTICKRRSSQTPFLAVAPPSLPPTTLTRRQLIDKNRLLPFQGSESFPRQKGENFRAALVQGQIYMFTAGVVIPLSRLRKIEPSDPSWSALPVWFPQPTWPGLARRTFSCL